MNSTQFRDKERDVLHIETPSDDQYIDKFDYQYLLRGGFRLFSITEYK